MLYIVGCVLYAGMLYAACYIMYNVYGMRYAICCALSMVCCMLYIDLLYNTRCMPCALCYLVYAPCRVLVDCVLIVVCRVLYAV